MIFALFSTLIQAKAKICICNRQCSKLCPSDTYLSTSNSDFNSYIKPYLKIEKEIELDLYSKTEYFVFDIDISYFRNVKVHLKTLHDSKSVNVAIMNKNSLIEQLKINPDHQMILPQLTLNQNDDFNYNQHTNENPSRLNIKDSTPDQSIITNPDGLINVTCDQFQYSDNWETAGRCVKSKGADHGSYTFTNQAKASIRFNGTKAHIFAYAETNSGPAQVFIDSEKVADINLKSSLTTHKVVFSSDELPFGEHLIEIMHVRTDKDSMVLVSIIYDPLPKQGGKLGFDQMEKTSGEWSKNPTNPIIFSSNSEGATGTFKFYGTRFWITGARDQTHGKCTIIIDDKTTENVDNCITTGDLQTFFIMSIPCLIYQSNVLPFGEHTVKIVNEDSEVSLVNFLNCNQPYNGVFLPYNELTKKGTWRSQEGGYLSRQPGSSLSTFRFFDHIWIVGNTKYDEAYMNVYLNDNKELNIDTSSIRAELSNEVVLYQNATDRNSYNLMIENAGDGKGSSTLIYLHISYCYYVNEKKIEIDDDFENIDIDSMQHDDSWTTKSGTLYTVKKGSKLTASYSGDKFWISGNVGPKYGLIEITLDGQLISSVSLYREKYQDNFVYYVSPDNVNFGFHTIQLSNPSDNAVNVHQIHYNPIPDDQGSMDNLDGLINITCDKFEYKGEWGKCVEVTEADHGSYTFKNGASASYTFNGTRAYVYAYREDTSPRIKVKVDDQLIGSFVIKVPTKHSEVIYSRNELPFGEHKIEIIHDGDGGALVLASFFIDPLPKRGGFKLSYKDRDSEKGTWTELPDGTPRFTSNSTDASITFKFHGT